MYRKRCAKKPNKPVQRIVGPANQGRLVHFQQPAVLEQDPLYEQVVRLFEIDANSRKSTEGRRVRIQEKQKRTTISTAVLMSLLFAETVSDAAFL